MSHRLLSTRPAIAATPARHNKDQGVISCKCVVDDITMSWPVGMLHDMHGKLGKLEKVVNEYIPLAINGHARVI